MGKFSHKSPAGESTQHDARLDALWPRPDFTSAPAVLDALASFRLPASRLTLLQAPEASDDPVVLSRIVRRRGTPTGTITSTVHRHEAARCRQRIGETPKVRQGFAALYSLAASPDLAAASGKLHAYALRPELASPLTSLQGLGHGDGIVAGRVISRPTSPACTAFSTIHRVPNFGSWQ